MKESEELYMEIVIRRGREDPWTFRMQSQVSAIELAPLNVQRRWFEEQAHRVFEAAADKLFGPPGASR